MPWLLALVDRAMELALNQNTAGASHHSMQTSSSRSSLLSSQLSSNESSGAVASTAFSGKGRFGFQRDVSNCQRTCHALRLSLMLCDKADKEVVHRALLDIHQEFAALQNDLCT